MNGGRIRDFAYLLLRVVTGLLFFQHGGQKLLGWFGGIPPEHGGQPELMSQVGIGGLLELVGGLLIMVGLFTRGVAFILSGMMAVTYFQFHQPTAFWPIENHGELAVLYCFIFLYMAAQGAGELSLEGLIRGRRGPAGGSRPVRASG